MMAGAFKHHGRLSLSSNSNQWTTDLPTLLLVNKTRKPSFIARFVLLLVVLQYGNHVNAESKGISEQPGTTGQFNYAIHYDHEISYGDTQTPYSVGEKLSTDTKVTVITHVNGWPSQMNELGFTYEKIARHNVSVTNSIVNKLGINIDHFVFYTQTKDRRSGYFDPFINVLREFDSKYETSLSAEQVDAMVSVFYDSRHIRDIASIKSDMSGWTEENYRNHIASHWARGALVDMAIVDIDKGKLEHASRLLKPAISLNHPPATYLMGVIREKLEDQSGSVSWFKKASDQGHVHATYVLALRYKSGTGIAPSNEEFFRLLEVAANEGHGRAAFTLGVHYLDGRILDHDPDEAVRWLTLAESRGVEEATPLKEKATKMSRLANKIARVNRNIKNLDSELADINAAKAGLELSPSHPLNNLSVAEWTVISRKMSENRPFYRNSEGGTHWQRVSELASKLGFL